MSRDQYLEYLPRCNSSKMLTTVQVFFWAALFFINACHLTCGSGQ
ncbi:hypothetical protein MTO96_041900, partial [Rhipicephalus appendiculatus]